jgi:uncharacterized protein (TIGR02118 family)
VPTIDDTNGNAKVVRAQARQPRRPVGFAPVADREETPMIKVIAPAQRHPTNRTLADFHRYWGESHGPLFSNTRRLRGYVQHLTLPEAYGGSPAPTYDGVSMFFYDDLASQRLATRDPGVVALMEGIAGVPDTGGDANSPGSEAADPQDVALFHEVLKDDAQLFDRSTSWPMHHKRASVAAEERVIVDGPTNPDMVKALFLASKLPGLTLLEFFHRWQHHHGPLLAGVPGLRRYVQNHAVPEAYAGGMQTHDGWAEVWFDDLAALQAAVDSPEWRAVGEDGATLFAEPMGVGVARERIQKDPTGGWTYNDWGAGAMSEEEIRARLAEQGYATLAADPQAPRAIKEAAAGEALAVWTEEHLVTFDASRIDARPGR